MADTDDTKEAPKPPEWERRENFAINERMKEVLKLTKQVAEKEIESLRRKLDKLTYGS